MVNFSSFFFFFFGKPNTLKQWFTMTCQQDKYIHNHRRFPTKFRLLNFTHKTFSETFQNSITLKSPLTQTESSPPWQIDCAKKGIWVSWSESERYNHFRKCIKKIPPVARSLMLTQALGRPNCSSMVTSGFERTWSCSNFWLRQMMRSLIEVRSAKLQHKKSGRHCVKQT